MEIERKFLVSEVPQAVLDNVRPSTIEQGYLVCTEGEELRIRNRDNNYTLTQKRGEGLVRQERETEISAEAFAIMWPFTGSRQLTKQRYVFQYNGQTCELDIYSGRLTGLIVMEAEFDNETDARAFTPPSYCTKEVTEDRHFKNATLAQLETVP